jgi:2-polyprenyl-3-methyl-5-hydroxy-6-metoxy-1,4-benzoquinol methylase
MIQKKSVTNLFRITHGKEWQQNIVRSILKFTQGVCITERQSRVPQDREHSILNLVTNIIGKDEAFETLSRYGPDVYSYWIHIINEMTFAINERRNNKANLINLCKIARTSFPKNTEYCDYVHVYEDFYTQSLYPLLENLFYLKPHGIWRFYAVLEQISHIIKPYAKCLDLGFGPGVILLELLRRTEWDLYGVDVSNTCVDYALQKIGALSLAPRVNFLLCDGRRLSFSSSFFDVIVATEVIEHVPNPELLVSELNRVLKSEGYLIITAPINLSWGPHLFTFHSEDEIDQLLENHGFQILSKSKKYAMGKNGLLCCLLAQKPACSHRERTMVHKLSIDSH